MFEKIRKMKNQKGFTLVELIVVLVILAILAAMLVPALTGYIDKANNQKIVAATRQVVMAAQTEISEAYGKGELKATAAVTIENGKAASDPTDDTNIKGEAIVKLAEVGKYDTPAGGTAQYTLTNGITKIVVNYNKDGHVTSLELTQGDKTCIYTEGETGGSNGAYNVP